MRRFGLRKLETLKTRAAAYGCCECPDVCSCDPGGPDIPILTA
jgi:hypothetical protein